MTTLFNEFFRTSELPEGDEAADEPRQQGGVTTRGSPQVQRLTVNRLVGARSLGEFPHISVRTGVSRCRCPQRGGGRHPFPGCPALLVKDVSQLVQRAIRGWLTRTGPVPCQRPWQLTARFEEFGQAGGKPALVQRVPCGLIDIAIGCGP